MLVTFKTDAYSNITMFGDVAVRLLKMMGHSGTIPGAILAEDVPEALQRLKTAIAEQGGQPADTQSDETGQEKEEGEIPVSLGQRAFPLIELLEAAAEQGSDVTWS